MSQEKDEQSVKAPDRSVPPPVHAIERAELRAPTCHRLSNEIPVYEIHGGTAPAVRIELMFPAGIKYQDRVGLASAVNQVMDQGTRERSATEIAEAIEYYGVDLIQRVDRDHAWIGAYVLARHVEPVLQLIREIWENAIFPQEELEHYIEQQKDELLEEREKVSFLAKQRFLPIVFGEDHPYGRTLEDPFALDRIEAEEVRGFYRDHYQEKGGVNLILSGKTEPWMIKCIEEQFGGVAFQKKGHETFQVPPPAPSEQKEHWVQKDGALQAAIRVGKPLFAREHPEFPDMVILSTLLGGYFGSRLMMNLREDKGYTYGVGCACMPLQDSGFFAIVTEVGGQVRQAALQEILKEIRRLSEEPVGQEELEHLRNYMQGSFLQGADGPFAQADLFKAVHRAGMDLNYYDRLMERLQNITPEELQSLAQKHLPEEEMRAVIAGDKNTGG